MPNYILKRYHKCRRRVLGYFSANRYIANKADSNPHFYHSKFGFQTISNPSFPKTSISSHLWYFTLQSDSAPQYNSFHYAYINNRKCGQDVKPQQPPNQWNENITNWGTVYPIWAHRMRPRLLSWVWNSAAGWRQGKYMCSEFRWYLRKDGGCDPARRVTASAYPSEVAGRTWKKCVHTQSGLWSNVE